MTRPRRSVRGARLALLAVVVGVVAGLTPVGTSAAKRTFSESSGAPSRGPIVVAVVPDVPVYVHRSVGGGQSRQAATARVVAVTAVAPPARLTYTHAEDAVRADSAPSRVRPARAPPALAG